MRNQHSAFSTLHVAVPVLALAFLALHLLYLPPSLEDTDSINFALGLHAFDVAKHQPHPPGYPLFILIAKGVRAFAATDARALSLVGAVAGALGVVLIAALFRRLGGGIIGTLLAIGAPLYWFTANRPLSDMAGLAAVLAVQLLIVLASTAGAFAIAACCAGLAVGLRSQVFWLTAPLLMASGFGIRESGFDTRRPTPESRVAALAAYVIGVLLWAVPLVMLSGGPVGYWRAISEQGAEDLSGVRMLWTTPTVRELMDAFYYAFVAPWAAWPLAVAVLLLAAIGAAVLWRRDRPVLAWLAIAYGPYLAFDLLFQETFTSRYALPLVVPVALLAGRGAWAIPANAGVAAAIAAAMFGAHVGGTSLAAYASEPAPAFRLLADLARERRPAPPVIVEDRREALDLRAPLKYLGGFPPDFRSGLPALPQHEALQVAGFLDGGHPVWFIADPKRTDIDLVQHGDPLRYRWPLPYPVLIDGVRPNEMDWHDLSAPDWWLDDGWSVTPELAGVSDEDRRGLFFGAIDAHLAARTAGGALVIGGRNFEAQLRPRLELRVGARTVDTFEVPPGAFVRAVRLPADAMGDRGAATLTVAATPAAHVAIEQFDASASRALMAFDEGWQEQEYAPATGLRWRWLSDHGTLRIVSPNPFDGLVLHLAGESPLKYFPRGSTVTIRADGAPILTTTLAADFSLTIPIARPAATITVETDQIYVPAERSWRSADRRRLGLRIFSCDVRAVSAPGR